MTRRQQRKLAGREALLFGVSLILVTLVAIAVADKANTLLLAIVVSAGVATALIRWLFPERSFFSLTFMNLVAVYASIFAFFLEELFGQIGPTAAGVGFCLPILFFLMGCWIRRTDIRAVIDHPDIRGGQALYGALVWLIPVSIVGAAVFVLSWFAEASVNTNLVFLLSMLVIGLIVLGVSRNVAIFLVDAGLLFEEFFHRMSRLAVPAFAFLTFYALLVIFFASIFARELISHLPRIARNEDGVPPTCTPGEPGGDGTTPCAAKRNHKADAHKARQSEGAVHIAA